ncbi:MAG: hypothetical protein HN348_11585 [Proteobacteria bacterium]|jgi:hypothetical protein|nr:hypothetical protein [Pseudomonadota bacterium]
MGKKRGLRHMDPLLVGEAPENGPAGPRFFSAGLSNSLISSLIDHDGELGEGATRADGIRQQALPALGLGDLFTGESATGQGDPGSGKGSGQGDPGSGLLDLLMPALPMSPLGLGKFGSGFE